MSRLKKKLFSCITLSLGLILLNNPLFAKEKHLNTNLLAKSLADSIDDSFPKHSKILLLDLAKSGNTLVFTNKIDSNLLKKIERPILAWINTLKFKQRHGILPLLFLNMPEPDFLTTIKTYELEDAFKSICGNSSQSEVLKPLVLIKIPNPIRI